MTDKPDPMDIENLPKPWTKKQYIFALSYLETLNAADAARKAGYSEKTCRAIGYENLTKPHIEKFIAERTKKVVDALEITPERIMREVAALAFSNILDYVKIDPETGMAYPDLRNVTREQAAAISSLEAIELPPMKMVENGEEVAREVLKNKLKFWDKGDALAKLMQRHNLVKPMEVNVNHSGKVTYDLPEFARRMAFVLAKAAKTGNNPPKGGSNAATDTQKGNTPGPSV